MTINPPIPPRGGTIDPKTINTPYWQTDQKQYGGIFTDATDIDRAIENILLTPLRTVPHHPDFGARAIALLDRPINQIRAELIRECYRAIERWEPRITVTNVTIAYNPNVQIERVNVNINWIVNNIEGQTEIAL